MSDVLNSDDGSNVNILIASFDENTISKIDNSDINTSEKATVQVEKILDTSYCSCHKNTAFASVKAAIVAICCWCCCSKSEEPIAVTAMVHINIDNCNSSEDNINDILKGTAISNNTELMTDKRMPSMKSKCGKNKDYTVVWLLIETIDIMLDTFIQYLVGCLVKRRQHRFKSTEI